MGLEETEGMIITGWILVGKYCLVYHFSSVELTTQIRTTENTLHRLKLRVNVFFCTSLRNIFQDTFFFYFAQNKFKKAYTSCIIRRIVLCFSVFYYFFIYFSIILSDNR